MRRREFITLLGGAAVAWPLTVRAQSPMPVIGFLRSTSLAASAPMIAGFRQGLTATGFNEGQNVTIEYRYANNQLDSLPGLVAELIRLPVAVIVANVNAALAAKAATTTVPIVFATGSDPVVDGLVAQPQPARRQRDRRELRVRAPGSQAAGDAAPARPHRRDHRDAGRDRHA